MRSSPFLLFAAFAFLQSCDRHPSQAPAETNWRTLQNFEAVLDQLHHASVLYVWIEDDGSLSTIEGSVSPDELSALLATDAIPEPIPVMGYGSLAPEQAIQKARSVIEQSGRCARLCLEIVDGERARDFRPSNDPSIHDFH